MKPTTYIAALKLPPSGETFMFEFKSEGNRSQFIEGVKFIDKQVEIITSEIFALGNQKGVTS